MPIICLSNTIKRWQTLKALKSTSVNHQTTDIDTLEPSLSNAIISKIAHSGDIFRIPRERISLFRHRASADANDTTTPPAPTLVTRADFINAESKIGSTIFGPIPAGHRREFFHDYQNVWIWHEGWTDSEQNSHELTVRYEVRTSGVFKKVAAGKYCKLEGDELENFRLATRTYLYMIKKYLYNRPTTLPA